MIAAACLALGLFGYELWPRDEKRISAVLNELCTELNQTRDEASLARLRQFLDRALEPEISVHSSELDRPLEGRAEVSERAAALLNGVPLSFALSTVEIHVSGTLARVELDLIVTVRGSGEQRRDLRHTRVRLAKRGDAWQIEDIEVDAVAPSEPEARP